MEHKEVPILRHQILQARLTLAIKTETKERLQALKHQKKVDITEWIRALIETNLPALEKTAGSL
jgi:hypothetical protein